MQTTSQSYVLSDDFIQCWQSAGRHLQMKGGSELVWMRAHLEVPFMEHLSFRLGNQLFFVRLEDVDGLVKMPGTEEDLAKIARECKGYACIMPMRFSFGNWLCSGEGWNLLTLENRTPVIPPDLVTDEKIEMTDWELHDFAVQVARKELTESGDTVSAWNSNPELQPSLWLGGDAGLQWVVLQAVRFPQEAKIPDNIHEIDEAYKARGAKGNFAYVSFSNEKQDIKTSLKDGGKPLPIYRGEKAIVSFSGLLDIDN